MNQFDVLISKVCGHCKSKFPLLPLMTLGEHSTITNIPDTPIACPNCGQSLYLHIQTQPYDLANHLDNPIAVAYYKSLLT